jgi:hypothetical protein
MTAAKESLNMRVYPLNLAVPKTISLQQEDQIRITLHLLIKNA